MGKSTKDSARIDEAFEATPRDNFVLPLMKDQAHLDTALPIGDHQTISQPSTLHMLLEWLNPQIGEKILDVGSGSGWSSALLANLVSPKGKIYAVEKVRELVAFGRANCSRLGISNIEFFEASDTLGLPGLAPFDRILVSATSSTLPSRLFSQLKVGGKMIVPVKQNVLEITKTNSISYETVTHQGFLFVPLIY